MIFGKQRQYKLPRFPDAVIPTFRRLSVPLPVEQLPELREQVMKTMAELRELARKNHNIDIELGNRLESTAYYLLDRYEEFDEERRSLIIGAVRYLITEEDPLSEIAFATGFDDDAQVMNHVLEELEIEDRFLSLD